MPSFDSYKQIIGGTTSGEAHKRNSDVVVEATWYSDVNSKTAYFYDQEHDDEFDVLDDLHPEKSQTKIPVDVKLFEVEYNSLSREEQPLHLQFKPSYVPNIPYYDEKFIKPTNSLFPVGLFLDYPDSKGVFHRYLVVGEYRHYANQFPTYLVLPCNHKLQWIYQGKKYESWCVTRSQSSYNAGTWQAYRTVSPENQKITWLSYNDSTLTLFYDQRVAISQPRKIPVCWKCTKVEDKAVDGIIRLTWAQDKWDEHTDYIETETDELGKKNVIGMWCDYYNGEVTPTDADEPTVPTVHSVITYNGKQDGRMKVGGSGRVFTVRFYDGDNNEVDYIPGIWIPEIDNQDASQYITVEETEQENQVLITPNDDDSLIGKKFTIGFETDGGISSQIELNMVGL